MNWWTLFLVFCSGGMTVIQSGTNAALKRGLHAPFWSLLFVSAVTTFGATAMVIIKREPIPNLSHYSNVPWWAWTGGLFGLVYVLAMIFFAEEVGAAVFTGLTITASLLVSLLLDHFGLIGFEVRALSLARIAGALLMISGIYLITRG